MTRALLVILTLCATLAASVARAEPLGPPAPGQTPAAVLPAAAPIADWLTEGGEFNPVAIMDSAARMLPGAASPARPGEPARAGERLSATLSVLILLTVISLVPTLMLMCTCFVRIIIVLGLLKQAIGAQTIPPPQVITALALFMTMLVMAPTAQRIHDEAIIPYQRGEITQPDELWRAARQPVRDFMFAQIEATGNWQTLYTVLGYRGVRVEDPSELTRADVDMVTLIPAYMLSELKTAFLMGFRVYLPFLVIDIVISALLISMSMMMLPPVLISLPFKLLLFVLVDGWQLVAGSLMASFAQPTG